MNRTARKKISVRARLLACTLVCIALFAGSDQPVFSREHTWQQIAEGLELGRFKLNEDSLAADSTIIILRVDPTNWEFRLLSISQTGEENGHTAIQWSEKHGLAAATNAGMFHPDYRTHVGYLKCGEHINSSVVNYYQSAAAFDPQKPGLPPFRLFDLDEVDMDSVKDDYGSVVQNLRLIKRPGENRWRQQPKKWSEAALGQDKDGRVLFIFCRTPFSMHDFNELLLSLPIGLVCAQHLEGGPEAQLYVRIGDKKEQQFGSFETGFTENDGNAFAWPVPNVIGIVKKKKLVE